MTPTVMVGSVPASRSSRASVIASSCRAVARVSRSRGGVARPRRHLSMAASRVTWYLSPMSLYRVLPPCRRPGGRDRMGPRDSREDEGAPGAQPGCEPGGGRAAKEDRRGDVAVTKEVAAPGEVDSLDHLTGEIGSSCAQLVDRLDLDMGGAHRRSSGCTRPSKPPGLSGSLSHSVVVASGAIRKVRV